MFASLDRGGAEAMIMNLYRTIDKKKVQFDFVVNTSETEYAHEKEIRELGGRIYYIPKYKIINYSSYRKSWIKLLDSHQEWKVIHVHHTSSAYVYFDIARKKNRTTISHSHTAGNDKSLKSYIKSLMRFPLRYKADYLFACSKAASKWMYGRKSNNTYIINNSIDAAEYSYNARISRKIKSQLGLENKFVVGHIGRFHSAKNHDFLIEVFSEVINLKNDSVLLLIGDGELKKSIKDKVESLGLINDVIFLGVRSDIPELLSAMDVFLFPSLYEGLPVTLIEAQASGIATIISDTITDEVKITNQILSLSLENNSSLWANEIMKYVDGYSRINTYNDIKVAGYDVESNASWIEKFYIDNYSLLEK